MIKQGQVRIDVKLVGSDKRYLKLTSIWLQIGLELSLIDV